MSEFTLRLQNAADTAPRVRLADLLGLTPAGALTARTGIRPAPTAGDVAVVAGTMGVTVQPFLAWVQGGASAAQGGYVFVLDAAKTLTLANGHASLSRTDVVAVVVKDDAYDGSGATSASVTIVQGTPGAGAPALPTNCLPLRNVTVPANLSTGTGGLASGNLSTDRRTYVSGLGGVVTVATQAERDALPATKGTVVYRADTDQLEVLRGGAWSVLAAAAAADTAWANVPLASGWAAGAHVPQYRRVAGHATVTGVFAKATWAPGDVVGTLPAGFRPSRVVIGVAYSGHAYVIETDGDIVVQSAPAGGGFWTTCTFPL